ncbi:hypothetical protein J2046_003743 [Rhizobium petrolearium]|uniref:hypothetical protein n=1 Tax=Neorhizobium petrolearium TaxID=515361 RepID=UPI001AE19BA5|nr:hypothetical protein [Neorhizobium petrolearium]MBP1845470.1 hypothetical protein [Neorhizobium petrolearium]
MATVSLHRFLVLLLGAGAMILGPVSFSVAQSSEAWTAFAQADPPSVQVSNTATNGRTIFLGGCNKLLGAGFTGSFSRYEGDALQRIDDQSEVVSFDIEGRNGTESFAGKLHYYAPDKSWVISELLSAAFVSAFGRGNILKIRNAKSEDVVSFELKGSSKAAKTMRQVCGLTVAPSALAQDRWSAMSTTAIAITGDIQISAEEIQFENGAMLQLALTDRPGVFRVERQANPTLKNENLLCGQEPPTFVVFGHDENTESLDRSSVLYLKIYNGKQQPPAADAVGMDGRGAGFCALFNYTR